MPSVRQAGADIVQEAATDARAPAQSNPKRRWVGLLAVVAGTTAAWVSILMLVSLAFGLEIGLRLTLVFALTVAALSWVAAAIAMAD